MTVVQWRAPKDLNTLMQRFGRAARDFSLQAVAILIAEPRWFLEDHQKRLARKRKRSQKGKRKASKTAKGPRPRADTGDVSSSDNDSGGETDTNTGDNNILPNADEEGAGEVEEAIKSIGITAGGKGCKRTTDKVIRLFINAHLLRGRKRCRRFHAKHYYRTVDIGKSIILDPISFC